MPALHAILRDGRQWDRVDWKGLVPANDGTLALTRVPGNTPAVHIQESYQATVSGLSIFSEDEIYIVDNEKKQVIYLDRLCHTRMAYPHQPDSTDSNDPFLSFGSLLLDEKRDTLFVADTGNGRIQLLKARTLELIAIWTSGLESPGDLAQDNQGRIYVADLGQNTILRYNAYGVLDTAYQLDLEEKGIPIRPEFIAIDASNRLYVSDSYTGEVLVFDDKGRQVGQITQKGNDRPLTLGAIINLGSRLFIADNTTGRVLVYDLGKKVYIGTVIGYQGPVEAMAADDAGRLYIKSSAKPEYYIFEPEYGAGSEGYLHTHRLDAGISGTWSRLVIDAEIPAESRLEVQYISCDDPAPTQDWHIAQTLDTLIYPERAETAGRYLWVRVRLVSEDGVTSPKLFQIHAEAGEMRYMQYLPALYERESQKNPFLKQWLSLFESEQRDLEYLRDSIPARFEPARAPADDLKYLAGWLGFELPPDKDEEQIRSLMPRVVDLYERRGTLEGVVKWVYLYSGIRIHIHESFQHRAFWQLEKQAALGFSTRLPALDPDGLVVPDPDREGEGWTNPESLVVGDFVVGLSGPMSAGDLGESIFEETAHHFCVTVAACEIETREKYEALIGILEQEKPAHTGYGVNRVDAAMRIGVQSSLGLDTIIAGPMSAMRLSEAMIGVDTMLKDKECESRMGSGAQLGKNTVMQ